MKTPALACATAALVLTLPLAGSAQPESGEVQEVLIKIKTDEGERWYRLGEELEPADIRPGRYVEFDYADDTIETISPPTEAATPVAEQAKEKKE